LVLDKFELSLEQADGPLVPLKSFEDVLIQLVRGILALILEG
jgi:hypothetical protein